MKKSLLILGLVALLGGCQLGTSSSQNSTQNSSPKTEESIKTSSSKKEEITAYTLKGTVSNAFNGNLEGVKVYVDDVEMTTTNSSGQYTIEDIEKVDSCVMRFVKDGYETVETNVASMFKDTKEVNYNVDMIKNYVQFGAPESKGWANYEAFVGKVSRSNEGMKVRFVANNNVFTSEGRNSKLELYFSVGEVSAVKNENITRITVFSDKTSACDNFGDKALNKNYNVEVNVKDNKTYVDVFAGYDFLGMNKEDIIGLSYGLWSEVDSDWAPIKALDTDVPSNVENPTTYVRCDKDNYCFVNSKNEYPKEAEYDKEALIAGRPYNIANPTNAGNVNADDLYLKVITNESSFTFDMVGFGEFADDEYIKLVLHTSNVDGAGWKTQSSDVSFLASKTKAVKKTGITDFWEFDLLSESDVNANHSLVHEGKEGYFTLSFEVDFSEIPNYSKDVEVSFFMFEFGAPGLYNADPWNKAMVVNGAPAGDPANQLSYQVIQEKEVAADFESLKASYNLQFSKDFYAKFERKDDVITLNILGLNTLGDNQFVRLIVDTNATPATGGWALEASDVSFVIYKDRAFLATNKTDFWADENSQFHLENIETLYSPVYEENEKGYFTLSIDIDYTELGLNINKNTDLRGTLIFFNPVIVNNGDASSGFFVYNGVNAADQADQNNYFII